MTLNELRNQIDEIDLKIKEQFLERMKVAEAIAESKILTGDKILKPEREIEVIEHLTEGMEEELKLAYSSFLKKLMEVSRTNQYRKMLELGVPFQLDFQEKMPAITKVCYQGLPCSYSEMATNNIFPDADTRSVDTFEDVFISISGGNAEAGVVPLENTTAGGVYEVYDRSISHFSPN